MRTDQDLLAEYMKNGETIHAANFLRHLTTRDRGQARRYPDPRTKKPNKSADWHITRSEAMAAIREGSFDDHTLLAIHIRDAFKEREGGDSIEARKQRAIEVFEACLDAAQNLDSEEERNFFKLVDAAADYAIGMIEAGKFPTHENVLESAAKLARCKVTSPTEGTRIMAAAHLSFLPWKKQKRDATGHNMKAGFKGRIK